ncbi:transposase [Roseovarius aestuariivivens]|uniref:transposase n=1 Tax=Roseovarius aestuariivivens TaxID=1888910 RepID=UPI003CC99C7D
MQSVPGVGTNVAATLFAEFPGIGTTVRRKTAARVGIAPIARNSGLRNGKRVIGGGRASINPSQAEWL